MLERIGELKQGRNILTEIDGKHSNMLMDISIEKMTEGDCLKFLHSEKEMAILLIDGEVTFKYENEEKTFKRSSVFDEEPTCLHVCKGVEVEVEANSDVELLVQLTNNENTFETKLYPPDDTRTDIFE